jgi:soluble lytic murein transglycosylase-like protein
MKKNTILLAILTSSLLFMLPRKSWATPANGLAFEATFKQAEKNNNLPLGLLSRMAYQESRYNPNAKGASGEIGIMQIIPRFHPGVDPTNPVASIEYVGRLMRQYYNKLGSWQAAIAAYNWGITNVLRYGWRAAPVSTQQYIAGVLSDIGLAGLP